MNLINVLYNQVLWFSQSDMWYSHSLLIFKAPLQPIAFTAGPLSVRWYGICIVLGIIIALSLIERMASKSRIDKEVAGNIFFLTIVSGIVGARLYYVLFTLTEYQDNWWNVFAVWQGGLAIHGALIAGVLGLIWGCKINKVNILQFLDLSVPGLALAQAVGRWGNFFNQEAYGSPTMLPWKLYIDPQYRVSGLEMVEYYHPTFLYESLLNIALGILLLWVWKKYKKQRGLTLAIYILGYSFYRFWIEGLRMDSLMFFNLRVAQLVSAVAFVSAVVWIYFIIKKFKR